MRPLLPNAYPNAASDQFMPSFTERSARPSVTPIRETKESSRIYEVPTEIGRDRTVIGLAVPL